MSNKKTHTVKEVDELNHLAEREGFMLGMVEGHRIFYNSLTNLRATFENMWAIYNQGLITADRKQMVEQFTFVLDTLAVFEDMFQDGYDTAVDNAKDPENYDELLFSHDLADWRDSVASIKEEWPE